MDVFRKDGKPPALKLLRIGTVSHFLLNVKVLTDCQLDTTCFAINVQVERAVNILESSKLRVKQKYIIAPSTLHAGDISLLLRTTLWKPFVKLGKSTLY